MGPNTVPATWMIFASAGSELTAFSGVVHTDVTGTSNDATVLS